MKGFESAFRVTNSDLRQSAIDDTMSGTTAIVVLVFGDSMYVANVGDSRAVAGVRRGTSVEAQNLSSDQKPLRKDEYERVQKCGARVLSLDQLEGIKDPKLQKWDEFDPPRLWLPNEQYPGTAFTRSVGDSVAESIGVSAEPEVLVMKISPEHIFFVVASDGVFEFLSSQDVVEMVRLLVLSLIQYLSLFSFWQIDILLNACLLACLLLFQHYLWYRIEVQFLCFQVLRNFLFYQAENLD